MYIGAVNYTAFFYEKIFTTQYKKIELPLQKQFEETTTAQYIIASAKSSTFGRLLSENKIKESKNYTEAKEKFEQEYKYKQTLEDIFEGLEIIVYDSTGEKYKDLEIDESLKINDNDE